MKNNFDINDVRKHWDKVASSYEPANKIVGYVHTQRFERAIQFAKLKPNERVLNIWSRTGNLIPYIRKTPRIDLENREASLKMIAIARKKYPKESFKQTDLNNLKEFKDSSFDKIISLETLEHTPDPQQFLDELGRIIKPKGLIVMSLPPRGFEIPTKIYDRFFYNHGEGPHQFLWSWEVKKLINNSNLKLVHHEGYIVLPLMSDKYTRASEQVLSSLFKHTPLIEFGVRHFYIFTK